MIYVVRYALNQQRWNTNNLLSKIQYEKGLLIENHGSNGSVHLTDRPIAENFLHSDDGYMQRKK